MRLIFLDFETYYSSQHSVTKLSPIVYALHPETEIISVSVREGTETTFILGEAAVKRWAAATDFSDAMVIGHNLSGFDGMIAAWRLGIRPKMWGCTLAMARPKYAKRCRLGLKYLAGYLRIGQKLSFEEVNTRGKHLKDLTADEIVKLEAYNNMDTILCARLFKELIKDFSSRELRLIDITIRMLLEPALEVDTQLLRNSLEEYQTEKTNNLAALAHAVVPELSEIFGHLPPEEASVVAMASYSRDELAESVRTNLSSTGKFKKFLESRNVDVPMKPSPSDPTKLIPALAKSDDEFLELAEHPDPLVAAAVDARLAVRSTLFESRIGRFLDVADAMGNMMPIPLAYYGADTTGRWSGIFKLNMQNLPRIIPGEPKHTDVIRQCLRAPEGYKVVVADLSGIELRVNMTLWKVPYAMRMFNEDPEADLYKPLASEVLSIPLNEVTKMIRQAGKAMHLGCGFGLGSKPKYIAVAKGMAQIDVTEDEAAVHIAGYRAKHPEIVNGWKVCHKALSHIANGKYKVKIDPWGLCETAPDGIKTPKGKIHYPHLRRVESKFEEGRMEWVYGHGSNMTRIYAGKVDENIVQHLAREVLADIILNISKTSLGKMYPLKHTVHDELIYVVRDEHAQEMLDLVQHHMRAGVDWWPELVTWSEGDIAQTYGDAK